MIFRAKSSKNRFSKICKIGIILPLWLYIKPQSVLIQQENEYPAIRFNPKLLQLLSSFNVSIEFDFENDFKAEDSLCKPEWKVAPKKVHNKLPQFLGFKIS